MENVKKLLQEENISGEVVTIPKNGIDYHGIRLSIPDSPFVSPVVYYSCNDSREDLIERIHSVLQMEVPSINPNRLNDWEYLKKHLYVGVQRQTCDFSIVKHKFLNLECYLYIVMDIGNEEKIGSIKLKKDFVSRLNIPEAIFWRTAFRNTASSYSFMTMADILQQSTGLSDIMYIVTSEYGKAASALTFPILFHRFCEEKEENSCYILPSSTEDLIILPGSFLAASQIDPVDLANLVYEINQDVVDPMIQLDPIVYYYDVVSKQVKIISRCRERIDAHGE